MSFILAVMSFVHAVMSLIQRAVQLIKLALCSVQVVACLCWLFLFRQSRNGDTDMVVNIFFSAQNYLLIGVTLPGSINGVYFRRQVLWHRYLVKVQIFRGIIHWITGNIVYFHATLLVCLFLNWFASRVLHSFYCLSLTLLWEEDIL